MEEEWKAGLIVGASLERERERERERDSPSWKTLSTLRPYVAQVS